MSRYDWPSNPVTEEEIDDPRDRLRYLGRLRQEFDPEGARRAAQGPAVAAAPHPPGPMAPGVGNQRLWQPLGPETLLDGQAAGEPRVTGRVNALAVHSDGQRAYAASANGGVWYTSDGGAHWITVGGLSSTNTAGINRPAQRNACGAIFVQFGAAEGEDEVFVGTGEVNSQQRSGQPGHKEGGIGILRANGPTLFGLDEPWTREAPNLVNDGVYRIVREPGGTTMLAATRTGLYQRPSGAVAETNWVRPTGTPFDTLNSACTDMLWTTGIPGTRPARQWVWVQGSAATAPGLFVRDAGSPDFERVAIDGASPIAAFVSGRAVLAAPTPPDHLWLLCDRGAAAVPALFRVTNPDNGGGRPIANGVVGVPNIVHGSGFYDIAIAVDPANPERVVLGGNFLGDPRLAADKPLVTTEDDAKRSYDAAIVAAIVAPDPGNAGRLTYGHPTPFTMLGVGVHPDVHALAFSNGGATLWTGCDGGVFRSDRPTRPAGFYPRNNGLSISETNFLAIHPTCEGHVVAGLQDNGLIERASSSVWFVRNKGDGGGVMLDANRPDRWLFQHTRGDWRRSLAGGTGPISRQGVGKTDKHENPSAAFYSSGASIQHVRTGAASPFSQTIVGTNRVWYTADFGVHWRTLPAGSDPLAGGHHNHLLDAFGEVIRSCRWQSPDVAWILGETILMRYTRTSGALHGSGTGTWTRATVIQKTAATALDETGADGPIRNTGMWTELAVNLDPPPAAGQPPAQHGAQGAVYLGTIGNPTDGDVDTLWWFDGDGHWFHTGLRDAVPAPVTSILCDPNFPNQVYVGTTVGVWLGVRTQPAGGTPTWAWEARLNGLPEAAVEDLALFSEPGLRLLRAAIASRGIWELRLDQDDVPPQAYVRAHADDLRYRPTSTDRQRSLRAARSWHGSPDVRPRPAPALLAAPGSLPWRRTSFNSPPAARVEQLRRFQAALRESTGDPRIVANGKWDAYFSEVLRDHGAPTLTIAAGGGLPERHPVRITNDFWNAHMTAANAAVEPWGAGLPTEADLYELTPRLAEGSPGHASCSLRHGDLRVEVVVHYRGAGDVNGDSVRVTLLRWLRRRAPGVSNPSAPNTWFTGNVPWTAVVNDVLNSADGITNQALGPDWEFCVGAPATARRLTLAGQTLDPLHSGVATFNLSLPRLGSSAYTALLVAVIRSGEDVALAPATLQHLALNSPNLAVRSVRVLP